MYDAVYGDAKTNVKVMQLGRYFSSIKVNDCGFTTTRSDLVYCLDGAQSARAHIPIYSHTRIQSIELNPNIAKLHADRARSFSVSPLAFQMNHTIGVHA